MHKGTLIVELTARSGHSPIAQDILGQALQYNATLAKGLLNKQEVEAIHLVVSEVSGCDYCLAAHTLIGKMAGYSVEHIQALRRGSVTGGSAY